MTRLVQIVGYAGVAVLLLVLVTTLWLWRHQERVVFQPPSGVAIDPGAGSRVELRAPDGSHSYAYVVEPGDGSVARGRTVVLAFHGNADLAVWLLPWARELSRRTGASVVIPEYRGYGGVHGRPTYHGVAADAQGALRYVRTRAPDRLVLFGHSLGSAIAVELAASMAPDLPHALALQSPFTSARDMAARMLVPGVSALWTRISRVHYDTRRLVASLDTPVWVSHGTFDLTIPARMGRDVYDAARRRGELLLVSGAGHNDVPDRGAAAYWQWLATAVTGRSAPVGELEEDRRRRLP